ncbi:MFS transporter [Pedobacter alpinus]|uniref:MFS transporter n=1 Tax=Pedobacter alpinus TaxID=1590643 RepID=A0ABW5TN11_9SPHI
MKRNIYLVILAQFLCTSLWFAGNAVLPDLIIAYNFNSAFLAHLTSAVQFGFIAGTLVFALLGISDRFSPSLVFSVSALFAAVFNLAMAISNLQDYSFLIFRFFTGFFLAGIYPVGMKIVADYEEKGLGKSLGFLVGALVLGTAFPHLLKGLFNGVLNWEYVIYGTSILTVLGGLLIAFFVPDGPFRKAGSKIKLKAIFTSFKTIEFRKAALGYFGHMWELYAFWAFLPLILSTNFKLNQSVLNVSILSAIIIGSGFLACGFSGIISQRLGVKFTAKSALFLSGICCLLSPLFILGNSILLLMFLVFWAIVVIADSPLFSTLVAQNCPPQNKGTSLTIVNCIGFSITIFSIQLMQMLSGFLSIQYLFLVLAVGPIFGLLSLKDKKMSTF